MIWLSKIQSRVRALFGKRKLDAEMDEEMRLHVEMRTQANIELGMKADEARITALRQFGWRESIRETCREQRGVRWMEELFHDLRFGVRMLGKAPGFTAIAVLVLALGTGANTTIFSIINSMLLKPVRAVHPEQIVGLYQHDRDDPKSFSLFSYRDFKDLRAAGSPAFSELFAFRFASVGLRNDLTTETPVDFVSANYFSAMGVAPAMGRWFLPEEEESPAAVAILTDAFWRRLGADPNIVGKKLELTRGSVTVVGVMPAEFTGAQLLAPSLFLPVGMAPALTPNPGQANSRILTDRGDRSFMLMGRLKPGLTLANADAALAGLNEGFSLPDPSQPRARTLVCYPPSRFNFSSDPAHPIQGLAAVAAFAFGLSMLVLLIACLNLANMMLARGAARQNEIAVRLAVGARRGRILRQLVTEGFLLALLGSTAGLLVSVWAGKLLGVLIYSGNGMPSDFPRFNLSPDWRTLGVVVLLSGAATIFFALAPAWKLARLDFHSDLKRKAGDGGGSREGRFSARELLAVGQMGCTLALLVAAVLFSRSAINAGRANPGFEFGSNFYLSIDTGLAGYTEAATRGLVGNAIERLSALPGVESVSTGMNIPFGNATWERRVQIGGAPAPSDNAQNMMDGKALYATYNIVGADYFHTLGIPLLRGREFEAREGLATNSPPVAVISKNLAERLWPGQEALGRTVQFPAPGPGVPAKVMTIVGIVPEIQWTLFGKGPGAGLYAPFGQEFHTDVKFHVRVAAGYNPAPLMKAAQETLHSLDPLVPLTDVKTLSALHREGPWMRITALGSVLFGAFGGLAVFLSLLGIYGLKSYAVARRTREIGIRVALGANPGDVTALILRESLWLALLGLALGVALAVTVAKVSSQFLYHVPALDSTTFAVLPPLLLAVVMLACWVPARRASKVDPMVALRHE